MVVGICLVNSPWLAVTRETIEVNSAQGAQWAESGPWAPSDAMGPPAVCVYTFVVMQSDPMPRLVVWSPDGMGKKQKQKKPCSLLKQRFA